MQTFCDILTFNFLYLKKKIIFSTTVLKFLLYKICIKNLNNLLNIIYVSRSFNVTRYSRFAHIDEAENVAKMQ